MYQELLYGTANFFIVIFLLLCFFHMSIFICWYQGKVINVALSASIFNAIQKHAKLVERGLSWDSGQLFKEYPIYEICNLLKV